MTNKRASADPSKEAHGLYMVEKYERVIDYLYPLAQTIPRKHGTFRELLIRQLFLVAEHLNDAIKANQLSRCYVLDGAMGQLHHGDGQNSLVSLELAAPCRLSTLHPI